MSISKKIKDLAYERGVSLSRIAKSIGSTKAGFYKMIDVNSFKVETLQKIANALDVEIIVFFTEEKTTKVDLRLQLFGDKNDVSTESLKITINKSVYNEKMTEPLEIFCKSYTQSDLTIFLKEIYDGLGIHEVKGMAFRNPFCTCPEDNIKH